MSAAGIGMRFTLARVDRDGRFEGPPILRARLQRIELEVQHVIPEDLFKRLRLRLIRLDDGAELVIDDPRACGGCWAVKRTA